MEENKNNGNIFNKINAAGKSAREAIDKTKKAAEEAGITGDSVLDAAKKAKGAIAKAGSGAAEIGKNAVGTAQEAIDNSKEIIMKKMDQNGDGVVDVIDIIIMGLKTPGVHIDREQFLKNELFKNYPQDVINTAIRETPAKAGIPREEIDKIADEVINYERSCVSGISAALGMPGGAAMAATIPADIAQYYGYTLRAAQKLLYLYGFPEIDSYEDDLHLDSETINALTLCLGIMYGAAGANTAIKGIAKALAAGVEKQLLKKALTKGTIYPFVKSVARWFGVNMTKKIFAGFFKNAIPVLGGVIGGGITFVSFKPCCNRLKSVLMDTLLSNPDHISGIEEDAIVESIMNDSELDPDFYPDEFGSSETDTADPEDQTAEEE